MEDPFIGASRAAFLAENDKKLNEPKKRYFYPVSHAMRQYEELKNKTEEERKALQENSAKMREAAEKAKYKNARTNADFHFDHRRRHEQFSKFGDPFNWSSDPANRYPEQFIPGTFDPKYTWMYEERYNEKPRFDFTHGRDYPHFGEMPLRPRSTSAPRMDFTKDPSYMAMDYSPVRINGL